MDYFKIGKQVRKYRQACGMSQEQLADAVSISTTHMSHIETGNTKLSLPVLVSLADVLGVKADDLLYGEEHFSKSVAYAEVAQILDSCTPGQAQVIMDIIKSLHISMSKYLDV